MPRKKKTSTTPAAEAETPDSGPVMTAEPPPVLQPTEPPQETAAGTAPQHAYGPDPRPVVTVSLSEYRGGPEMHLLRSHKYHQMQIRFDGKQPDERHLARLHDLGWKDRTEAEGVWTKQIDRAARWQSVQRMEQEFKGVANEIRREKGLEPALTGMTIA